MENKQTLKSLNFANKTKDLKRVKYIFSHRQLANLIKDKLKRNIELQKSTQINYWNYSSTKHNYNCSNSSLPRVFLRDIYERMSSLNDAINEQSLYYNKLKRVKHGRIPNEKSNFLRILEFLFS